MGSALFGIWGNSEEGKRKKKKKKKNTQFKAGVTRGGGGVWGKVWSTGLVMEGKTGGRVIVGVCYVLGQDLKPWEGRVQESTWKGGGVKKDD